MATTTTILSNSIFDNGVNFFNNNKYIYGFLMILLNVGARYIEMDIGDEHRYFLSSKVLRRLIIFTIAFIGTRDLLASLIITCCFIILVLNLFNRKSKYCIISKSISKIDTNNDGDISDEEIKKAYETLLKAGKNKKLIDKLLKG